MRNFSKNHMRGATADPIASKEDAGLTGKPDISDTDSRAQSNVAIGYLSKNASAALGIPQRHFNLNSGASHHYCTERT